MLIRFLFLALLLPGLRGAVPAELIREAGAAEARQDSQTALQLYLRADKIDPGHATVLQKIARQYSDLADAQAGIEGKKHFAEMALEYSRRAVALNPDNAVNVLSLAVCHGKLALYGDAREKVKNSRLVWEEANRALTLDPNYAWAHHVLGLWNCEVATLGAPTKIFARLLYGSLPPASIAEGVRQLQLATRLEPDEMRHWLQLGFACLKAGENDAARTALSRCLTMPSRGPYDDSAQKKARDALTALP